MLAVPLIAVFAVLPVLAIEQEQSGFECLPACNQATTKIMWEASKNFLTLTNSYAESFVATCDATKKLNYKTMINLAFQNSIAYLGRIPQQFPSDSDTNGNKAEELIDMGFEFELPAVELDDSICKWSSYAPTFELLNVILDRIKMLLVKVYHTKSPRMCTKLQATISSFIKKYNDILLGNQGVGGLIERIETGPCQGTSCDRALELACCETKPTLGTDHLNDAQSYWDNVNALFTAGKDIARRAIVVSNCLCCDQRQQWWQWAENLSVYSFNFLGYFVNLLSGTTAVLPIIPLDCQNRSPNIFKENGAEICKTVSSRIEGFFNYMDLMLSSTDKLFARYKEGNLSLGELIAIKDSMAYYAYNYGNSLIQIFKSILCGANCQ